MSSQKTTFASIFNKDWGKVKVMTEKVNTLLKHIPTDNVTEQNKRIYVGTKLISDKINISLRNPSKNNEREVKDKWIWNKDGRIKKLQKKELQMKENFTRTQKKEKVPKREPQKSLTTPVEEMNQKFFGKNNGLKKGGSSTTNKISFQNNERQFYPLALGPINN